MEKVSINKVVMWMKDYLNDDWYIGYYSTGHPYIDTKQVIKDFKKAMKENKL